MATSKRLRLGCLLTAIVLFLVGIVIIPAVVPPSSHQADWTVMVYMCGDNDFEQYADKDFRELARVGSSQHMNVVVQFDRAAHSAASVTDPNEPQWSETLRFLVQKNMAALRATAYENLGEQDMSSGKTLAKFVADTQKRFPAQHYALVMWGHGDGFRFSFTSPVVPNTFDRQTPSIPAGITRGSFKSGTPDDSSPDKRILYNSELADSLHGVLAKPLDILFFDECIMGSVETAYGERHIARRLVASEDLVPGDRGVPYATWLGILRWVPWLSPSALCRVIVRTYQLKYLFSSNTMSAFDLRRMDSVGRAVSALGLALKDDLPRQTSAIIKARAECVEYANVLCDPETLNYCLYSIDLERFCWKLIRYTSSWRIRWLAAEVIFREHVARIANGASPASIWQLGSHGLSIYFPRDGERYCVDRFNNCGYEKNNTIFPVAFVAEQKWTDFLHAYFAAVMQEAHPDPLHPQPLPSNCASITKCSP